jgi:isoquinoline 1-oxidoreductase alpha subunit
MTTNKKIQLQINGSIYSLEGDGNMPLLWVLRDELGLVGTKYGCGMGLCGACSVLIDGVSTRSCLINVGSVNGEITTIEGLGNPESPHNLQEAWIENQVAQCGYCQPGQIINACGLLAQNPAPSDSEIENAMLGNLCRCGTYSRIRKAIRSVGGNEKYLSQSEENN